MPPEGGGQRGLFSTKECGGRVRAESESVGSCVCTTPARSEGHAAWVVSRGSRQPAPAPDLAAFYYIGVEEG